MYSTCRWKPHSRYDSLPLTPSPWPDRGGVVVKDHWKEGLRSPHLDCCMPAHACPPGPPRRRGGGKEAGQFMSMLQESRVEQNVTHRHRHDGGLARVPDAVAFLMASAKCPVH